MLVEAVIDGLGTPADRAGEPAGVLEGGKRDHVALPLGEQVRHRVLHERERAGLQRRLAGDPLHQLRLDLDAHPGGRQPNRIGHLGIGHRADRHRAPLDGIADTRVAERAIEVVGAQRRHEADDTRGTAGDVHDHLQEGPPFAIIDGLGEQLLELVDDHDQLGALRKDVPGDVVERAGRGRQLAGDVGRGDGGDAPERCGQPFERRRAGHHLGDQPRLGTGERTIGESGQQAGLDHRGLADARRADDDEQRLLPDDVDHLADGALATVEVVGVGLLERLRPAVRVAGRYESLRRVDGSGECVSQLGRQFLDGR